MGFPRQPLLHLLTSWLCNRESATADLALQERAPTSKERVARLALQGLTAVQVVWTVSLAQKELTNLPIHLLRASTAPLGRTMTRNSRNLANCALQDHSRATLAPIHAVAAIQGLIAIEWESHLAFPACQEGIKASREDCLALLVPLGVTAQVLALSNALSVPPDTLEIQQGPLHNQNAENAPQGHTILNRVPAPAFLVELGPLTLLLVVQVRVVVTHAKQASTVHYPVGTLQKSRTKHSFAQFLPRQYHVQRAITVHKGAKNL